MHVRKFEADSLEEALKEIKKELGPDAIILKTVTNKGLKGAFKRKKVEITAAISEKNYVRKAKVDMAIGPENSEKFYEADSSYVSNMIDEYNTHQEPKRPAAGGYGNLGLNRSVQTTKGPEPEVGSGLDSFLKSAPKPKSPLEMPEEKPIKQHSAGFSEFISREEAPRPVNRPTVASEPEEIPRPAPQNATENMAIAKEQNRRIEELEKQLYEMKLLMNRVTRQEPEGVYQLVTTLKSLDINQEYINGLIKKCLYEIPQDKLEDADHVFEFALHDMMELINTEMARFSSTDAEEEPVITVLMSSFSCGQTSMLYKLMALKEKSKLIRLVRPEADTGSVEFIEKMFNLDVVHVSSVSEIAGECRKAIQNGQGCFIDFRTEGREFNDSKNFVDGLRRSFENVEVLISLSAIHTELYNRKVITSYRSLADGLVVSFLDECLNFGALFNIAYYENELPFKFFGTGKTIPDDVESATAERILAGIFQLE